jgi:gas vesicle protein
MDEDEIENDAVFENIDQLVRKLKELRYEIMQQVNNNGDSQQLSDLASGVSEAIGNLDILAELLGSENEELKHTLYSKEALQSLNDMGEMISSGLDTLTNDFNSKIPPPLSS